ASDTTHLEPAPRRGRIDPVMVVDPHNAGLDSLSDTMSPPNIARPDAGCQPKLCIVGNRDRRIFVVEGNDAHDRAKDFFLRDTHPAGYAGEHRGKIKVAAPEAGIVRATAAGGKSGAFFDADGHILF